MNFLGCKPFGQNLRKKAFFSRGIERILEKSCEKPEKTIDKNACLQYN
jgi:hypothetical protein